MLFLWVNSIGPFLMCVGSLTIFKYFLVSFSAVIVMVLPSVSMLMSFSSILGSSAKTLRQSPSSKMSTSGGFFSVKLGMWGSNVKLGCVALDLFNVLATWKVSFGDVVFIKKVFFIVCV